MKKLKNIHHRYALFCPYFASRCIFFVSCTFYTWIPIFIDSEQFHSFNGSAIMFFPGQKKRLLNFFHISQAPAEMIMTWGESVGFPFSQVIQKVFRLTTEQAMQDLLQSHSDRTSGLLRCYPTLTDQFQHLPASLL